MVLLAPRGLSFHVVGSGTIWHGWLQGVEGVPPFLGPPAQLFSGLVDGVPQPVSFMDGMCGSRTGTNGDHHQGSAWEVLQDSGAGSRDPEVCEPTAPVLCWLSP